MSKTVDERVVEMRFDNGQFEKNVSTTMSTLDKFKQKLNLSGAAKGLDNINSAAKKVDMSGLGSGVEAVSAKFSALQVMGVTALANVTNSAVNAGKRMISALTIDPVKDGLAEYETQMNAVQTILANTQKEGTNVKVVNKALDELNTYADKTIYNFTEMTRNIGTFTAAGVKLDTSVSSIKGIANLAAISGSNSQQASTAMYQLSQAIASGTVKLMDWNSVVNAGMGGQVFQDALIRTSEHLKTGAKAAIDAKGSFRESLQTGWMTTEVLTQTLDQFATAADTQQEYEAAVKKFIDQGYTKEEAKQMADMAKTAGEAATKVKTFSQLIDTLKEALGSGWAQTWRLIIGDFEQARTLWTEVSDVLSNMINKSSDARNDLIQGWANLGGRDALIESFKNSFLAISKILKPIGEAFREVFPRTTAEQLYKITDGLRNFTKHLIISDGSADKLKQTFKGLFSFLKIGVDFLKNLGKGALTLAKNLTGIDIGFLDATASLGDWLVKVSDSIKETVSFEKVIGKITGFISNIGSKIKESFNVSNFGSFFDFFNSVWKIVTQVCSSIIKALSSVGSSVAGVFSEGNFFEALNNGILAGILVYIAKFVKGLTGAFDEGAGVLENIKGILDDVRECFQAYQDNLKAGTLLKIASAIGILAASLWAISTIDGDALARALGGITVLFAELIGSMKLFDKLSVEISGVIKSVNMMIGLSVAILILAGAMKKLSSLDWNGIAKGLVGVGALMAELSIFLRTFKFEGKFTSVAFGIILLSTAMLILANAVNKFGEIEWSEIGKGLVSIGALLTELAIFTRVAGDSKNMVSVGAGLVLISASMKIFASSVKDFGGIKWSEIGKGLTAMAGVLAEVALALNFMPKNTISIGVGLVAVGAALKIIANSLSDFGGMSWDEIGRGLVVMGGALAELAIALNFMNGTLAGSAALIIAAGALAIIMPVLTTLGEMSVGEIAKSLITLAGAFAIIGIAGYILTPLIPSILGLSAAFALLGIASLGIGSGLVLIATGITALSVALSAGVTSIVAGLSAIIVGIADLIPTLIGKLAEGIVEFAKVIGECAPQLAEAFLKLLSETLSSLSEYTPKIVSSLVELLIGIINSLSEHIPELVQAAVNFIGNILQGIIDALNGIDTTNLIKTIVAVGLMTALTAALAAIVPLIPSAMVGVIGVGTVVAELALVLAAIGGLAQIPGLSWLIGEGGNLLQSIGTAIGQFVGGIVGGVANGITSSLPGIAKDLSNFMTEITPFVEGAKALDASMMDGVKALGESILILTAGDILNGIASFVTGGNSLSDFAKEIIPFGNAMKTYSEAVKGIDSEAVTSSANAAKTLSELSNNLPNEGGWLSKIVGDNTLGDFSDYLEPFGKAMKAYSDSVKGIDSEAVTSSANAAKTLSELSNNLPNEGGWLSKIVGDNSLVDFGDYLVPFGKAMKEYSDSIKGLDTESITASANAAKTLSELANNLPNEGGLASLFAGENTLGDFGRQLISFGSSMKEYAIIISEIDTEAVTASANAAKALAELSNNLPNNGGLVSLFSGDNTLGNFGTQIIQFGSSMKAYANSISGIDTEAVIASSNAAKSLAELANNLPNTGGLFSLFSGDNSLDTFGYKLISFGYGMKKYASSISGIDTDAVTNSATAAKALVGVSNALQNGKSLLIMFAESNNLSSFASQLTLFGIGMKSYASSVAGVNIEAITASASAAKALVGVYNALNSSGGIISLFKGNSNLSSLGNQLVPFGKGMKAYASSVSGIDTESITNSVIAAKALMKVSNSLNSSGGIISLFKGNSNLSSLGNQLVPFGKGMKQYSKAVTGINVEAITNSATAAKSLVKISNSLKSSGGLKSIFTGDSNLSSLGSQLVPFGKSLKQYSDSVSGINADSISGSATAAKKLVSLINSMSGINTSGVSSFKSAIDTLSKTNISGMVNAFSGSTSKLSSVGSKLSGALVNGFKTKQSSLTTTVNTMLNAVQKLIISRYTIFRMNGTVLIAQLASGMTSSSSKVTSGISHMLSVASSSIRRYHGSFYSAGGYLATGFANGISSNTYLAVARSAAMASQAYQAAKKKLDINSPSKVFRRLGYSVPEGFAQGIDRMSKCVDKSSVSMAGTAIRGTEDALRRITNIISDDVDSQPTISPVVDLSDVKRGVNAINGYFNNKALVGVAADVNAVSLQMNRRGQNGVNDDVVSAINKLRKDLENNIGPSYTVNGITYDDGTNVSEAIKSLVRAARIERRI